MIVATVVTDPRCPQHPRAEVYKTYPAWRTMLPPVWTCACCRRPLGRAGLHPDMGPVFPQDRQPTTEDRHLAAIDWDWLLARSHGVVS